MNFVDLRTMDEEVLVHELINSLAFEVEAIATENVVKFTSANGTPLNVKVRLRNKDEPRLLQRGLVSVPKLGKHITTPARIISSDQTILSFNVLMETELERQPTPKNRKHGFNFLKLGCLGTSADEDEDPYLPDTSNKKDLRSKTSSKSDSAIVNESGAARPLKLNLGTTNVVARNQGGLFGKCKPGGCLDPPFSEDKYPYGLPKTQPHIKLKKTLNLAEDSKENRNISISNDEPGKATEATNEPPKNIDNSRKYEVESKPLLNIYARTNSLQNSQTSNHSNSIITYPPELSSSEMINNDQNARKRSRSKTFSDGSPKQSYEYPESYFIPPKDIRQKEEERRYSRELSNDQIRFNDRNRDETSQNNGNQRKSPINNLFDPDINTTKYSGIKTIPQSGKGSKDKDKSNKEMIKQTLTDLTLENKDKPQKLNATQQKNSITLLETPKIAQLNKKTPSLMLTGSKNFDEYDKISKSPIEKSQEYEQPQTKLRYNIQEPLVIDHTTPDLASNQEKSREMKSEIPDNIGLAKDITNKNTSRYVENQGNIGPIKQRQTSDMYEMKPKLDETKDLHPSAVFKNGTTEDKSQQFEPISDNSDLDISLEEKRLMVPSAKPIKSEINQTFGQDNGPTESQYKSIKAKELTKLSLGNKLLKLSLQNLLDNHDLNNTTTPDVAGIKYEQPNAINEPENYAIKNSQISPVKEKPQLQTIDSPAYTEENYGKDFNPLRSGTNAEIRKETEAQKLQKTPYNKTSKYPSDDSPPIKSKSNSNRVQDPPKSSAVTETTQENKLDGVDIKDIQNDDPKARIIIAGTENKFTQQSAAMFETPNKQMGDIRYKDIDNQPFQMSTDATKKKDVSENSVNLKPPKKLTLDTQDRKSDKNAANLNKNKVIDTKPIEMSLKHPANHGTPDVYLNDDDKDTMFMKTASDATIIPSKSPYATDSTYANNKQKNVTDNGLSSINKTKPIQTTETREKDPDSYTSKTRPMDALIIPSKTTNVKETVQEPLVDSKDKKHMHVKEGALSSFNESKSFPTDTKKQNLENNTSTGRPMDASITPKSTNVKDISQEPLVDSKDIKYIDVIEDRLSSLNEAKSFPTDPKKQDFGQPIDATIIPSKTANVKEMIQDPLIDSKDPKNIKMNEDGLSSFNKTKPFQTDTNDQDFAASKVQPMNTKIIPAKSTPIKDIIQDPVLDSKDTKNINRNEDGLSSFNKAKPFQSDTKEPDFATSKVQPMNATIAPTKSTVIQDVIQEPVLDSKDTKIINGNKDDLSSFNEAKPFQANTKDQELATSKAQPINATIVPAKTTAIKDIIQDPVLDSKNTKNINGNEDGLSSFNEANPFQSNTKEQELATSKAQPINATIVPAKPTAIKDIIQDPVLDSKDTKNINGNEDGLSSLNEAKPFQTNTKEQELATSKAQPINATIVPAKTTAIKDIIQDPVLDSIDTKNINGNEDGLSSFNKAKPFQTNTKEQGLDNHTSQGRPLNATMLPAKVTNDNDVIQEPLVDSKDTKHMNGNEDGLFSLHETKPFQTDTKEQDLDNHTSKGRPLNATMLPVEITNVKDVIQEPLIDSKDKKHMNGNEDGLSTLSEAKTFQTDSKQHDLDSQISQTRPKRNVKKLNLNQMPRNLFLHDSVSSENKEYATSSTHSIDSYDNDDNNDNKQENNEDYNVQKVTPKNENHLRVDNVIVQNDSLHDQNKIPDLAPKEKNSSLQKTPFEETDESNSINKINPLKHKTFTIDQSGTPIEKQLADILSQQNITDEYARTKVNSKYDPHGLTPNSSEDLDEVNKQLIQPDSAMDLPKKTGNELLNGKVNQLKNTDTENQSDPKAADYKYNLGSRYQNIDTSGSNANKIYQKQISLAENQENVNRPFDKPLNEMDYEGFHGKEPIKGLSDIGENVFFEHTNLNLDQERTAIDKKSSINNRQNELEIASVNDSKRILADKNDRLDSTSNVVDDVLSYRSKTSETENRNSHNYKNWPLDPSSQIPVNNDTLTTVNEAQYHIKNYDDTSKKVSVPSQSIIGGSGPIVKKALPLLEEIVDDVDEIINVKNQSDQADHDYFRESIDFGIIEGFNKEIDYTPQDVTKHYGMYKPLSNVPASTNCTNDDGYSGIGSEIMKSSNIGNDYTPEGITKHYGKYDPFSKVPTSKIDSHADDLSRARINLNSSFYNDHLTKPTESTTFYQQVGSISRNQFQNEPSRTSVEDESAALLLNLSFQSYVNENGETIVRTFHPLEEPQRYVDDKITAVNSFLRLGNEIRIPVGPDHDLALNLCRKYNAPDGFNIRKNYTTNASLSEHIKLAAKQRDDVLDKSLALIYERELIPLHNIIKNMTEEINSLSGQQEQKDRLLSAKRTRSLRLVPTNNRCGCKRN